MTIFGCGRGGITRVKTAGGGGGGGPTTPSIIGSPIVSVNSTGTHNTGTVAITPTAATELIVVAVMMSGSAAAGDNHLSSVSSDQDGALTIALDGPGDPFAANARPGWGFAWIKPTTTGVEHTITYTVLDGAASAAAMLFSAAIAFNIEDIDTADPIGAVRSIINSTDVNTLSDSITVETADCLLLSFGCAQGNDTDPFTADFGASLLATGDTGGGSASQDGGYGAAEEVVNASGATSYGLSWASADGCGIGAIEIRVKPA